MGWGKEKKTMKIRYTRAAFLSLRLRTWPSGHRVLLSATASVVELVGATGAFVVSSFASEMMDRLTGRGRAAFASPVVEPAVPAGAPPAHLAASGMVGADRWRCCRRWDRGSRIGGGGGEESALLLLLEDSEP